MYRCSPLSVEFHFRIPCLSETMDNGGRPPPPNSATAVLCLETFLSSEVITHILYVIQPSEWPLGGKLFPVSLGNWK